MMANDQLSMHLLRDGHHFIWRFTAADQDVRALISAIRAAAADPELPLIWNDVPPLIKQAYEMVEEFRQKRTTS